MRIKTINPSCLTLGGGFIILLGIALGSPYKWIVMGVGLLIVFTGAYLGNEALRRLDSKTLKARSRNQMILTVIMVALVLFHLVSLLQELARV